VGFDFCKTMLKTLVWTEEELEVQRENSGAIVCRLHLGVGTCIQSGKMGVIKCCLCLDVEVYIQSWRVRVVVCRLHLGVGVLIKCWSHYDRGEVTVTASDSEPLNEARNS